MTTTAPATTMAKLQPQPQQPTVKPIYSHINTTNDLYSFKNFYKFLSSTDNHHDKFEKEWNYYFPDSLKDKTKLPPPTSFRNKEYFTETKGMEIFLGDKQTIDTNEEKERIDKIEPNHGLEYIKAAGYIYGSLKRYDDDNKYKSISDFLKNKMEIEEENIYFITDLQKGLYKMVNKETIKEDDRKTYTAIFTRATGTDPAPNALPILKKPRSIEGKEKGNVFKLPGNNLDNYNINNNIPNRLNFAIESPNENIIELNSMTPDGKKISDTLCSKHSIKLSYVDPTKIRDKKKAPNC